MVVNCSSLNSNTSRVFILDKRLLEFSWVHFLKTVAVFKDGFINVDLYVDKYASLSLTHPDSHTKAHTNTHTLTLSLSHTHIHTPQSC